MLLNRVGFFLALVGLVSSILIISFTYHGDVMSYLLSVCSLKFLWALLFFPTLLWGVREGISGGLLLNELESLLEPQVLESAKTGTVEAMQAVLDLGGNIYATDNMGRNVFHYAAEGANGPMILWLAEIFAVLGRNDWRFEADAKQKLPLHYAAMNEYFEATEVFIGGAGGSSYINVLDVELLSPLFYAAMHGRVSMIEFLLEHGAFVEGGIEMARPETPLHYAIEAAETEAVKALIEGGAHMRLLTRDGLSPIDLAFSRGHTRIIQILLVHIARVYRGLSLLHRAVLGYALGLEEPMERAIIQRLEHVGCLDIIDGYGLTPYQYAELLGLTAVVEYFREFERLHNITDGGEEECIVLEAGNALEGPTRARR